MSKGALPSVVDPELILSTDKTRTTRAYTNPYSPALCGYYRSGSGNLVPLNSTTKCPEDTKREKEKMTKLFPAAEEV